MVEYDLKEIATVSGKPGLFKVIKPTRSGVIIETLDESKRRMMIQTRHKISLLQEISIFTTNAEGSSPLDQVFAVINDQHGNELSVDAESSDTELSNFIEEILPEYDRERVYNSDVKKLISWYNIVNQFAPPTAKKEEPKAKKAKAKKKEENSEKSE